MCLCRCKSVIAGHARKTLTQKPSAHGVSLRLHYFLFFSTPPAVNAPCVRQQTPPPSAPQEGGNRRPGKAFSPPSLTTRETRARLFPRTGTRKQCCTDGRGWTWWGILIRPDTRGEETRTTKHLFPLRNHGSGGSIVDCQTPHGQM